MQYFIGVDGGGTGCRLRLAAADGRVLAEARGGPSNIATDPEAALRHILNALDQLLSDAGLERSVLARTSAALGLAGANITDTATWAGDALPFGRLRIVTDAWTSTCGALGGQDGIVAALGTGSVFGRMRGGLYHQIGGWGFHLGDEGSGAVLGRQLLAGALRALDGCQPMTPLAQQVLEGFADPSEIPAFARSASPADYARYAPALVAAPEDPLSAAILDAEGRDIIRLIDTLQGDATLPVTWTGGLGPLWAGVLGARWPQRPVLGSALDGAMALARGEVAA